jgi:hypothetical protein
VKRGDQRKVSQTQCDSPPAAVEVLAKDGEVWVFELGHHELVQNGLSVFATLRSIVGERNGIGATGRSLND